MDRLSQVSHRNISHRTPLSGPSVKDSKNKDLIGLRGIVAHETENTIKIITVKNQLKGELRLGSFILL
jgi:RNase P/RNase MRP subunit p29